MSCGSLFLVGDLELADCAAGVIRPILSVYRSVNQRLPYGPATMSVRPLEPGTSNRDDAARGDASDLIGSALGEPQVAVGTGGDTHGSTVRRPESKQQLLDGTGGGVDLPDLLEMVKLTVLLPHSRHFHGYLARTVST